MKLTYADNKYGLLLTDVNCDLLNVENAICNFAADKPETYEAVESACVLFQKGFLPHNGYWWSEIMNENIRQKLAAVLREAAEGYHIKSDTKHEQGIRKLLSQLSVTEEDE